jgi:hypothetical protein
MTVEEALQLIDLGLTARVIRLELPKAIELFRNVLEGGMKAAQQGILSRDHETTPGVARP